MASPLSFDEARAMILGDVERLGAERVALDGSRGRVLAEDLVTRRPLPPFDHSAMDGYALATSALAGAGPWSLPVRGESSAGVEAFALAPGAACRIFTGAAIPIGADAVVMQENVTRHEATITLTRPPSAGQNIRRAGEDMAAGVVALATGFRLTPGAVALAAMLDVERVSVGRRPRVVILCTGDELRPAGSAGTGASIPESNSAALAALARQAGADVTITPMVGDDADAVARALDGGVSASDVLVTVGGVSVGDHDLVRPALERVGVRVALWRVAIKPGKPLVFGRRGGCRVLGLPGNPASALVTFALFGMPLLRALQGDAAPVGPTLTARLSAPRKRGSDRLEFVRARLVSSEGSLVAVADDNQASGAATSLATSEGLAFVPAGSQPIEAGALVEFLRWADA